MSVRGLATGSLIATAVAVCSIGVDAQLGQALPERQLPVFRSDSHFVRVDAYPTAKDGSIIEGLTGADFEIFEDGKRQVVDTAEYIEYERWSPGAEPPMVETQRDSFRLAADPRYRVVVVYVNRIDWTNAHYVQQPLIDFLTREIGPRDLYGLLLPHHEASDLILGKFTPAEQARLKKFLGVVDHNSPFDMDPLEQEIYACFGSDMLRRWRVDNMYRDLEGIITILGTIRDERKSLILVTETMPGAGARLSRRGTSSSPRSTRPSGRPPRPPRQMPGVTGLAGGTFNAYEDVDKCDMIARDAPPEDPDRFDNLIDLAQRMNVAINPVNPAGLTMRQNNVNGYLRTMATQTGGIPVVNMNDIKAGLQKIAHDMPAYYLLGYYTTNTKWDGKLREIKVKLKSTGKTIRARREYQAPSAEDMAAMRAAAAAPPRPPGPTPIERALSDLARLDNRPEIHVQGARLGDALVVAVEMPLTGDAAQDTYAAADVDVSALSTDGHTLHGNADIQTGTRGAQVRLPIAPDDTGPWQLRVLVTRGDRTYADNARIDESADSLFSPPLLYRAAAPPAAPLIPAADRLFYRSERLRAEWTVASPTPVRLSARLLSSGGTALSYVPPVVTQEQGTRTLAQLDLPIAALAAGDYLIELTAERNGQEDSTLMAIRVVR